MRTISNNKELQLAIVELSEQEAALKIDLQHHYNRTVESLKPANLIKNVLENVTGSVQEETAELSDASIGIIIGTLLEKVLLGKSPGLIRKTIAGLSAAVATNIAIRHAGQIKTACARLMQQAVKFFEGLSTTH
jgi:F0F1-type ATP synthase assembly protein I